MKWLNFDFNKSDFAFPWLIRYKLQQLLDIVRSIFNTKKEYASTVETEIPSSIYVSYSSAPEYYSWHTRTNGIYTIQLSGPVDNFDPSIVRTSTILIHNDHLDVINVRVLTESGISITVHNLYDDGAITSSLGVEVTSGRKLKITLTYLKDNEVILEGKMSV